MLGVAALTIVMSVTGGFQEQFREKVLGVNAHVLVLKYSIDFREYRDVMKKVEGVPRRRRRGAVRHQPDDGDPRRAHRDRRAPQGRRPRAHAEGARSAEAHRAQGASPACGAPGAKPPERPCRLASRSAARRRSTTPPPARTATRGTDSLLQLMRREVDDEMTRRRAAPTADAHGRRPRRRRRRLP